MYEELLIGLRGHAKRLGCDDRCPCYDAENRGYATCSEELAEKAADAIEELSRKYTEERNAAVELTGELASKPRWIPVTEQLPEEFQKVLVFWREHSEPMIDTAFWQKDAKRFDGEHWVRMEDKITHWMPLPEPPKEDA